MTHTPGPWPVEDTGDGKRIIVGGGLIDGYDIAEVYSDDCDRLEAEANGWLIAAAPELLEALDFMVSVSRAVSGFSPMARQQAERAIAKARGAA